jgi:hypothetical protein
VESVSGENTKKEKKKDGAVLRAPDSQTMPDFFKKMRGGEPAAERLHAKLMKKKMIYK